MTIKAFFSNLVYYEFFKTISKQTNNMEIFRYFYETLGGEFIITCKILIDGKELGEIA